MRTTAAEHDTAADRPSLSVVIPCRDVEETLGEQLSALLGQEWSEPWEVVVVDNGSTDGTGDLVGDLMRQHPRLRLVRATEGSGISYARNAGVRAALGDAVAICDGDDVVAPGWVAAMGRAIEHHQLVTGPLEVEELNPQWLARSRGSGQRTEPGTYYGLFPCASGGNIGFRREVWESLGGFDERMAFLGAEDVLFSLEAHLAGIDLGFAPDAVLHYRYRTDAAALFRQGRVYGRGRVAIASTLRDRRLPRPPALAGWRSWLWLLVHLLDVRTPEGRAVWSWVAGNRLGQLEGSVHQRIVLL